MINQLKGLGIVMVKILLQTISTADNLADIWQHLFQQAG